MSQFKIALSGLALASALIWTATGQAASHQWRISELFTNADGTVQFIEMKEIAGASAEWGLKDKWLLVVGEARQYTFRSDLTGNTAGRYLLLGTQGFKDTPGAPAPDIVIPDGFLPLGEDVLEYWMYPDATIDFGPLPVDGATSYNIAYPVSGPTGINAQNSPTNYAGESGSIDLTVPVRPATWGALKTGRARSRPTP
jgi:hypothetical protein